jgi:hypothetical protein
LMPAGVCRAVAGFSARRSAKCRTSAGSGQRRPCEYKDSTRGTAGVRLARPLPSRVTGLACFEHLSFRSCCCWPSARTPHCCAGRGASQTARRWPSARGEPTQALLQA